MAAISTRKKNCKGCVTPTKRGGSATKTTEKRYKLDVTGANKGVSKLHDMMLRTNVQETDELISFLFVPNMTKEFISNNELMDEKEKKSSEQKQLNQKEEDTVEDNATKTDEDT